jgi:EAL and modified HD-GYP domain-containing signal transduction protein
MPHTLALMAKNRMDLMSKMWKLIHPKASKNECDEAYFIGALSLLDAIMQVPLRQILEEFYVSPDVKEALLRHGGKFGKLFRFIKAIEECDDVLIDRFLRFYKIDKNDYEKILYETSVAVNRLDEDLESMT